MRIMKILCGLLVILMSLSVQAEKFQANEIKFGRPQSTKDKVIYYGANGLMRFNETDDKFEMSSNGGANWFEVQPVGGFADNVLGNLLAPTAVNVPLLPASGSSIDIGSLLLPWGDIMVGYDLNSHFQIIDPATNVSALEIGATTGFNGDSWGINAPVNNNRQWLSLRTGDNPAGPSNGIAIETGDATLAGDSGDIYIKTGEENGTGGARGEVLFNSSIVDFQNVNTVDFTGATVLGIAGGGGGILWSTPVNADILPSANNTYNLGASNNFFVTVNGATGKFANIDNLTGTPINVLKDLTMTGLDITGLSAITVDSINQTGVSGIDFNAVELKNASDPTTAQSLVTRSFMETQLALAVGFDPTSILVDLLPSLDNSIDLGSVSKRWNNIYVQNLRSVELIEGVTNQPLNIKTGNQGGGLSGDTTLSSGDSNFAGGGGDTFVKSGNNAIGESGNIILESGTAGSTRGEISLNGSQVNANSTKIINLADPTNPQDAVTKSALDTAILGVGGGGGTDWSVPIDSDITVAGGNFNLGSVALPLAIVHQQAHIYTDKIKEEMRVTTINGTTPKGFGYEMAMRVMGENGNGFALYGENSATADANPTKNLYFETGNKTAGTGNSGDIYISTGTSAGGDRGSLIIDSGGMSLSNGNIIDLANPVDPTDAVNLQFLNSQLGGFEDEITAGTTLQYFRGDKTFQTLNTSVIPEVTNLYYTQTRFDDALTAKSTTNLSEGTNLYHTDERVDDRVASLIQDGTGLAWTYVDGSNTFTGNVSLTSFSTTDLSEGTNLYYTNTRADGRISLQRGAVNGVASLDGNTKIPEAQLPLLTGFSSGAGTVLATDTILQSIQKLDGNVAVNTAKVGYTSGLFDTDFGTKTTNDLTENTNLYFTNTRAISAPITGFSSGAGTLAGADTILQAIQKLDGNIGAIPSEDSATLKTTGASSPKFYSATINCNASSTLGSEIGTWISAVGNRSGASCLVTFNGGAFTGTPMCQITHTSVTPEAMGGTGATSAVVTVSKATATDYIFNISCHGI